METTKTTQFDDLRIDFSAFDAPLSLPNKPPVDASALAHRELKSGLWWQKIPAYVSVDEATFLDHKWQAKNSVTSLKRLLKTIQDLVSEEFYRDVEAGFRLAPMNVRVSPYVISLIDWSNPLSDPLVRQFIPVGSTLMANHPKLELDSLHEKEDSPTSGLTHRYYDKALFLPIDTCPVYCRFCTRSYAIGGNTAEVEKHSFKPNKKRWAKALAYVASRPELEDIVISGGDVYNLRPTWLAEIGHTLLDMPNIRRIRLATKGPAILPQKIITDEQWLNAVTSVVEHGRRVGKEVAIHTHFNHPNEITEHSQRAMNRLHQRGITVRNQTVLQRGVNDTIETMTLLVRRLSYINVHPYYVYLHDLVQGVEDLRTSLAATIKLEKWVRGSTAGFNIPNFVCDAPGGGGKREIHSYEHYDRTTGISVWRAPCVKANEWFYYFDPIHTLSADGKARWADPSEHEVMIAEALAAAKKNVSYLES